MATYNVNTVKNQTLGAGTEDIVNFSTPGSKVRVVNRSATNPIYFRCDNVAAVVGADDNFEVEPNSFLEVAAQTRVVRLISAGAQVYTVMNF